MCVTDDGSNWKERQFLLVLALVDISEGCLYLFCPAIYTP
jgi:hypothetical protein